MLTIIFVGIYGVGKRIWKLFRFYHEGKTHEHLNYRQMTNTTPESGRKIF